MRTAADTHKASRTADESALRDLVASLSDTARTARAQQQLTELIRAGGAATVLGLLLDRLLGNEGVKGAGARRAVAKILEEAMGAAGVDGLSVLPKLVALAARVLGDGESTVRDSFSHALASAARSAGSNATGKELLALLIRPLLRVLDGRTAPLQQGCAQATRDVLRALAPHQLRPCAPPLVASLRKHLRTINHPGRPALLVCGASLFAARPESCAAHPDDFLAAAVQAALSSHWQERLAAVALLEQLGRHSLGAHYGRGTVLSMSQLQQLKASMEALRFDKVSTVRQAAGAAQAACDPAAQAAATASSMGSADGSAVDPAAAAEATAAAARAVEAARAATTAPPAACDRRARTRAVHAATAANAAVAPSGVVRCGRCRRRRRRRRRRRHRRFQIRRCRWVRGRHGRAGGGNRRGDRARHPAGGGARARERRPRWSLAHRRLPRSPRETAEHVAAPRGRCIAPALAARMAAGAQGAPGRPRESGRAGTRAGARRWWRVDALCRGGEQPARGGRRSVAARTQRTGRAAVTAGGVAYGGGGTVAHPAALLRRVCVGRLVGGRRPAAQPPELRRRPLG